MSSDYKGMSKIGEYDVFTPFLVPEEEAVVNIDTIKGKTIHSSIVEITEKSLYRKNPKCNVFTKCGSCKLLNIDYEKTLEYKRDNVKDIFKRNKLNVDVSPVIGMERPYNYRNKVIASFSMKNGKIIYGMYEEASHNVIYSDSCRLQNENLNYCLKIIKESMESLKIKPEGFGGQLRHVLLRIGVKTNEVMVCLVANSELFPGRGELVKRILKGCKEVKTIVQNINPRNTSVVLGDKMRVLFGPGFIYDELLGNRYKISATSFYQVNPAQTEKLYQKAMELADVKPSDIVIDAYSGIGTISMSISRRCKKTIGIEIVKSAVNDSIENSKLNKINNSKFYLGDAKDFMMNFDGDADVLIIDPPRTGCDKNFIDAIIKLRPKKVVYISCNPETQARDLALLKNKYDFNVVYPVDMFPFTSHVETIVMMSRTQR